MASPVVATASASGVVSLAAVDGVLVLTLDCTARFDALRTAIRDTFSATPDRHRGQDARLDIGERTIDLFDLRRLVHCLKDEFGVSVHGLYCTQETLRRYAERELKLRLYTHAVPQPEDEVAEIHPADLVEDEVVEVPEPPPEIAAEAELALDEGGVRLLTIDKPLRSGQIIRHAGDVIIYGDVNPGAEVVASGNILVFGALKGMAHAGARGDVSACIVSFDFRPTQLRIGRNIAFPPREQLRSQGRSWSPQVAWVQGEHIVIEPYQGRLPR